jgi:hypothetical protein
MDVEKKRCEVFVRDCQELILSCAAFVQKFQHECSCFLALQSPRKIKMINNVE